MLLIWQKSISRTMGFCRIILDAIRKFVFALFTQNFGHNRRFQANDYNLEVTNNRMKSPQMTEYKYAK